MIKKKPINNEISIDLTGPQGNVFFLIGTGVKWCKQLEWNADKFKTEMMSADYEHAVDTFDRYFGHFCTLYR